MSSKLFIGTYRSWRANGYLQTGLIDKPRPKGLKVGFLFSWSRILSSWCLVERKAKGA